MLPLSAYRMPLGGKRAQRKLSLGPISSLYYSFLLQGTERESGFLVPFLPYSQFVVHSQLHHIFDNDNTYVFVEGKEN